MDELRATGLTDAFLTLEQTYITEDLFEAEVWVAESEDEVQGFVAFSTVEIAWLYVHPACYRQGVGRLLLRHAMTRCDEGMTVEVLVGNEAALALYLSEGFHMIKRTDGKLTGNASFTASAYVLCYA